MLDGNLLRRKQEANAGSALSCTAVMALSTGKPFFSSPLQKLALYFCKLVRYKWVEASFGTSGTDTSTGCTAAWAQSLPGASSTTAAALGTLLPVPMALSPCLRSCGTGLWVRSARKTLSAPQGLQGAQIKLQIFRLMEGLTECSYTLDFPVLVNGHSNLSDSKTSKIPVFILRALRLVDASSCWARINQVEVASFGNIRAVLLPCRRALLCTRLDPGGRGQDTSVRMWMLYIQTALGKLRLCAFVKADVSFRSGCVTTPSQCWMRWSVWWQAKYGWALWHTYGHLLVCIFS